MIYIATNKDNKDALMHYGVKGMKWGKRGGSFKWPWDRDDDSNKNRGKSKYGTAYGQRGAVGQAIARDEIGRRRGASGVARSRNLYPDTATRRSPGSNISTGSRPQQNKLSTSQKTSSAPSKRTKEYFNRQLDRQRADERNQQLTQRQMYSLAQRWAQADTFGDKKMNINEVNANSRAAAREDMAKSAEKRRQMQKDRGWVDTLRKMDQFGRGVLGPLNYPKNSFDYEKKVREYKKKHGNKL